MNKEINSRAFIAEYEIQPITFAVAERYKVGIGDHLNKKNESDFPEIFFSLFRQLELKEYIIKCFTMDDERLQTPITHSSPTTPLTNSPSYPFCHK